MTDAKQAGLFGRQGFLGLGGKENPYLRVTHHADGRFGDATIHFAEQLPFGGNAIAFRLFQGSTRIPSSHSAVLTKPLYNGLTHPTRFIIVEFSGHLFYKSIESSNDEFIIYDGGLSSTKSKTPIVPTNPNHPMGGFWGSPTPTQITLQNQFGHQINYSFGLEKPSGIILFDATSTHGTLANNSVESHAKPPRQGYFFGAIRKLVCRIPDASVLVIVNLESDNAQVVQILPNAVVFRKATAQAQAMDVKHVQSVRSGGFENVNSLQVQVQRGVSVSIPLPAQIKTQHPGFLLPNKF